MKDNSFSRHEYRYSRAWGLCKVITGQGGRHGRDTGGVAGLGLSGLGWQAENGTQGPLARRWTWAKGRGLSPGRASWHAAGV